MRRVTRVPVMGVPRFRSREADPYFGNVVLLVDAHAYANGSTPSTVDVTGKTPTWRGNAACTTSAAKFGASCLYFDGTNDRVSFSDSADFAFSSGDWTVEAFICPEGSFSGGQRFCLSQAAAVGGFYSFIMGRQSTDVFKAGMSNGTTTYESSAGGALASDNWAHVALCRSGNTLRLFVNGVLGDSITVTGITAMDSAGALTIGGFADVDHATNWKGWIDQVRITKGVARYTASTIVVPTAPFPHHG